ncbi:hypothetical protein NBCG_02520 [Nocardioidaceae bacterium Broad-1]|nr:hypothetical protein NBCG_02520 [Nocardioidaceae bacterium Broad-1]
MSNSLSELARWADPASTAVLLGAGVSIPSGAPSWTALKDQLVRRLDPNLKLDADLPLVSEILERQVGRRALIEETIKLVDVEPIGGIRSFPKFPWKSIYTTNYDRLIEKSAEAAGIEYATIRSRFDLPALEQRSLLPIFKLHGCISQDRVFGDSSSLILTKGDYRKVRSWKEDLLRRMQIDMESGKVLILGHSLTDPHLDEMVDEIVTLQDEIGLRNRVAILLFSAPREIQEMYESRGISVTVGDIDAFVAELSRSAQQSGARSALSETALGEILSDTLAAITVDVGDAVRLATPARRMFSGAPASYYDIAQGRTFERDGVNELLVRLRRDKVAVVLGAAGLGKTTMGRQVALRRRSEGVRVWEHRPDLPLDVNEWARVNGRLVDGDLRGLLVLDNITSYQRAANDLLRLLDRAPDQRLEILATAERHRWSRLIKNPRLVQLEPFRPRRLSAGEVSRLLVLSRESEDIRQVVPSEFYSLSDRQQRAFLERQCKSDIFICLRNIFFSTGFDSIVLEEYSALEGDLQEVYRVVAAIEAICGGSHRQLVLRLLDLDYRQIGDILDDLTGLMAESSMNTVDGIYVWRTRHPEIADIITRYKYADPAEHLDLVRDLIECLRPTVDIEKNAIRGLCNNPLGIDFIRDGAERLAVIEALVEKLPQDHVLRHRLVREFVRSGSFAEAEQVLEKAINDVGLDPPLLRYRIELNRLRAQATTGLMQEDREALLRWAWSGCQTAISQYSENWYSYRSLAEVAIDWHSLTGDPSWLDVAHTEIATAQERLYEPELDRHLQRVDSLRASDPST